MPQHVETARTCYFCGSVDVVRPDPPKVCAEPTATCEAPDDPEDSPYGYSVDGVDWSRSTD
jgi:hypothetical protein